MVIGAIILLIIYTAGFPIFCFILLMRAFGHSSSGGLLSYLHNRFTCLRARRQRLLRPVAQRSNPGSNNHADHPSSGASGAATERTVVIQALDSPQDDENGSNRSHQSRPSHGSHGSHGSQVVPLPPSSIEASGSDGFERQNSHVGGAVQIELTAAAARAIAEVEEARRSAAAEPTEEQLQRNRENVYGWRGSKRWAESQKVVPDCC
jgi:hypothetical protein